jgi:hypothetical protein
MGGFIMKKHILLGIIFGILLICPPAFAGMEHEEHEHSEMKHEGDEGVKTVKSGGYVFKFDLIDMKERMKGMDMDMGGMTHHLMVSVEDESGKKITDANVKYKVFSPGGKESETMAMVMSGAYGADISMSEKGKHGIACLVKIGDKKELVKIQYEME